jgi:type 2 lantibiotic biosynthesis protein LanM
LGGAGRDHRAAPLASAHILVAALHGRWCPMSNYYQALTLSERVASSSVAASDPAFDAELARIRLDKWRSQAPFTNFSIFLRRLETEGLSEDVFLALLGQSSSSLESQYGQSPAWLNRLVRSLSNGGAQAELALPDSSPQDPAHGLLRFVAGMLFRAREETDLAVRRLVAAHPDAPFDPEKAYDLLFRSLPQWLLSMLSRTLVLEMHVARLEGQLAGDTPEARFEAFTETLRDSRRISAIFEEYPVLARLLLGRIDFWSNSAGEMLSRLCEDWEQISAHFAAPGTALRLETIDFAAGDLHCGGRSVSILRFSSGFTLVYKPRSPSVHVHFNDLLRWIEARGGPALRHLKILTRPGYYWVEFVKASSCDSPASAERFYRRQGSTLALLHALRATDFHSENLIAVGEHPVLVDLESLFGPEFERHENESELWSTRVLANSVMAVGLLPQRTVGVGDFPAFEFSGFGGRAGQVAAANMPVWEASGTDQMRLVRRAGRLKGFSNLPSLDGRQLSVAEYSEPLVNGFIDMYHFLLAHRQELGSSDGPLEAFAKDEIRIVLRPTRLYARLLEESYHPDLLRNAINRERLFDRLWYGIDSWPPGVQEIIPAIIAAERYDLWNGDIPYFGAIASGIDLIDSQAQLQKDFFAVSGLAAVRTRLLGLNEDDLEVQLRFVRGSLAVLAMNQEGAHESPPVPIAGARPAARAVGRNLLLGAALKVGDRLGRQALRNAQEATWVGVSLTTGVGWAMTPLGLDLYSGLPGITLFLACLGKLTGESRHRNLAEASWRLAIRKLADGSDGFRSIGAFEGLGGMLYAMTTLALLWDRSELLAEAAALVDRLPPMIDDDRHLDLINGSAGCIAALLALHRLAPRDRLLDMAIRCGGKLVATAQRQDQGLGWPTPLSSNVALTGFSHGAAGMGWSLMQLFEATGVQSFKETAAAAFEYERAAFNLERRNWPDFRNAAWGEGPAADGTRFMTAWCNGAPGIGLSRLHLWQSVPDSVLRDEVEAALLTTRVSGFGNNLSLCHGDLGNIEIFARASRWLDRRWHGDVERRTSQILGSIENVGYQCGVPLGIETPGLLAGLAGIGLGLLRLADPIGVPCVLLLELPGADRAPTSP